MVKNSQKYLKIGVFFIKNQLTDIVVDTTYIIARKIDNIPNKKILKMCDIIDIGW